MQMCYHSRIHTMPSITLIIIGVVAILLLLFVVATYNKLVRGKNMLEEAWSGIDVQLKRRHDLIPSLVNTVKGYASHERETLEAVLTARAAAMNASGQGAAKVGNKENQLTATLRSLFALAENYPNLKANENFLQLQGQLATMEDEIQMARRYYNGQAREQNNRVLTFPTNLLAGMFGFGKEPYFEMSEAEKAAPEIKF